jgi:hypothetical protein
MVPFKILKFFIWLVVGDNLELIAHKPAIYRDDRPAGPRLPSFATAPANLPQKQNVAARFRGFCLLAMEDPILDHIGFVRLDIDVRKKRALTRDRTAVASFPTQEFPPA